MSFAVCMDDTTTNYGGVIEIDGLSARDHRKAHTRRMRGKQGPAAPPKPREVLLAAFQPKMYVEFGSKDAQAGGPAVSRTLRLKNPDDNAEAVRFSLERFPRASKHFSANVATGAEVANTEAA